MKKNNLSLLVILMAVLLLSGCFGKKGNGIIISTNLALGEGKEYFASSVYDNRDTLIADMAFDGDLSTRWSAGKLAAEDEFIGIDFGVETEYSLVEIDQGAYPRIVEYVLQSSDDGENYTDIPGTYTVLDLESAKSVLSVSFDPVSSKYLRLYVYKSIYADKESDELKEPSIFEFGIYMVTKPE